jgi:hypothetical protein
MVADRFPNKKFWCKKPNEYSQTTWFRLHIVIY